MIENLNQAFEIIKSTKFGIPYDAIRYVRSQAESREIIDKIVFSLNNAYDEGIFPVNDKDATSHEPLWYAVIAESFTDERLIDPVLNLFRYEQDWKFLNEQGLYLVGQLAEKYPEIVPEKALSIVEEEVGNKSKKPYYYLFNTFYYLDLDKCGDRLLNVIKEKDIYCFDMLAMTIGSIQFKAAVPYLEERLNLIEKDVIEIEFSTIDIEDALEKLKTGKDEYPIVPYFKKRKEWEDHYKKIEKYFEDFNPDEFDPEDGFDSGIDGYVNDVPAKTLPKKEAGRNDPCPCGSGKKYKKCCMNK
jgi:hypothetical protein